MRTEFDSTYPTELNGIITADEFQISINRINRMMISKRMLLRFLQVFISITTITGIVLIIMSAMNKKSKSSSHLFYPLSIAGAVIVATGVIIYALSVCFIQAQRSTRTRRTIAQESMKYALKSPIPSIWRLETMRDVNRNDKRVFFFKENNHWLFS